MSTDVFVVGALHLDVIVNAPALPRLDETVVGQSVACRFGGKGGNQAVAAARMGAAVAMAGRVGRDAFAGRILAELDRAGVARGQVRPVDGDTGMSVAIVEAGGNYGAVIVSGVNGGIDGAEVELPAGLKVLLLQSEVPEAVNIAVAAGAAPETLVVLNAAPQRPVAPALLARVDLLVANRLEASVLTGGDGTLGDPAAAARHLAGLGPGAAIVTLGGDGHAGCRRGGGGFSAAGHAVEVISTHGAGDAFVGALAAELARGAPLEAAASFAQAAGALHVSTPVARRHLVTEAQVRAFRAAGQRSP